MSYNNNINTSNPLLNEEPGQFTYVKDEWTRKMLINAWQAITNTELWDFVKEDTESFMFSSDPRVTRIYNKMEELGYRGHSGASFGFTMRTMQFIAKHGEEEYKKELLTKQA